MSRKPFTKTTHTLPARKLVTKLPCFALLCLALVSCRNDMEKVHLFDRQQLPQQSIDSVRLVRSMMGVKQMTLTAPQVVKYDQPERKTVYPKGVTINTFDPEGKRTAYVYAKYGVSFDNKKIIEVRDSVIIIDYRTGDTTYMENLVWNSGEHRVYSMNTVKSVNGGRVTIGDGFESDDNFEAPLIIHQRGTIEFNDE